MRYGRYVAMYPASILVYAPRDSTPARVTDLATVLKRAGHFPVLVTQPADLPSAIASGEYDLVLAGLEQATEVLRHATVSPSAPAIVPVLLNPTDGAVAAAKALSTCIIRMPSDMSEGSSRRPDNVIIGRGATIIATLGTLGILAASATSGARPIATEAAQRIADIRSRNTGLGRPHPW